jgi:hypothetical protein
MEKKVRFFLIRVHPCLSVAFSCPESAFIRVHCGSLPFPSPPQKARRKKTPRRPSLAGRGSSLSPSCDFSPFQFEEQKAERYLLRGTWHAGKKISRGIGQSARISLPRLSSPSKIFLSSVNMTPNLGSSSESVQYFARIAEIRKSLNVLGPIKPSGARQRFR